jgi:plastocyanin
MRSFLCRGILLVCLVVPVVAWSDDAVQVRIDNFSFGPAKVTVAKGAAVTWTNQDDIPHSIVLTGLGVRSKALDSDAAFSYRFDKVGTFSYVCGLHPFMHGQVTVK